MIHFPPLRTGRLDVQLRELTISEAVALAATTPGRHEAGVAEMLRHVVKSAGGEHSEPGRWTVQERMLVVGHYLSCVSDAADFELGSSRFSSYLDHQHDSAPQSVDIGELCGDRWECRQLTGDQAAAMEQVCRSRFDWVRADMAARMHCAGDAAPPDASAEPGRYADWLSDRVKAFGHLPESDFAELFAGYRVGLAELHHLFVLGFDDQGHVALGRDPVADTAPARFPVSSCLSRVARALGS